MTSRHIAIVGGGFAGAVTAIKLLDTTQTPLVITVIEPRSELGRGVAYSTTEPVHLVNGAARIFGLHPDDPDHLVRWLETHGPGLGWQPPADVRESSPPRWLYGTYVQSELRRAIAGAAGRVQWHHVQQRAIGLDVAERGWSLALDNGDAVIADEVVLALGVFQGPVPTGEAALTAHPLYIADPWNPAALDRLAGLDDVLLIGSSLSMVDVVASLEARGFAGCYHVVSRRGQVVEARSNAPAWRDFLSGRPLPRTARALLAAVKAERRAIAAAGGDWQALPLAIRPHIVSLWQGASGKEQLRFARHLRAFWDVTAHRAAPEAYASVRKAQAEGRFIPRAGRLLKLSPSANRIAASIRWRATGRRGNLLADGVVNCRGHQLHDWTRIDDPLVRSLLSSGLVRPHETGFGIDATPDGSLIDATGVAQPTLHAIGHPLRGVQWESSSIGEQLTLAIALADKLNVVLKARRASA